MRTTFKGRYVLKNPQKYVGNPNNVICRSSWEYHVCEFFDTHPSVKRWASEEFAVPYVSPVDGRVHKYYPDFLVTYQNRAGETITELVEVKPSHETRVVKKMTPEAMQKLAVNEAKWAAAAAFGAKNGIRFKVVTENELFRGSTPPSKARRKKK